MDIDLSFMLLYWNLILCHHFISDTSKMFDTNLKCYYSGVEMWLNGFFCSNKMRKIYLQGYSSHNLNPLWWKNSHWKWMIARRHEMNNTWIKTWIVSSHFNRMSLSIFKAARQVCLLFRHILKYVYLSNYAVFLIQ